MNKYDMSDNKSEAFFDKTVFGGYEPEQVDEFVSEARKLLTNLKKENEILKQKLKILADKIEEYRAAEAERPIAAASVSVPVTPTVPAPSEPTAPSAAAPRDHVDANMEEKNRQLEALNRRLTELTKQAEQEQARLETLRQENADFMLSLVKQYEEHLQVLRAAAEQRPETKTEPDMPADETEKVYRVARTDDREAEMADRPEAEKSGGPAETAEEPEGSDSAIPPDAELQPAKSVVSQPASGAQEPPIADQIGAGDSVYLKTDETEGANLTYEEALALVLKKNGILQDTPAKPAAAVSTPASTTQPKHREDPQATKIIPRMPAAASAAHDRNHGKKAKKDGTLFKTIKNSIHAFLEDDDSSEGEADVFTALSEKQKKERSGELQFGKAYNVKKDR